jgi:4-amino-4-deoxy-L-arabinose transferase-like glycosyltransferase
VTGSHDVAGPVGRSERLEIAMLATMALAWRAVWVVNPPPMEGDTAEYLRLAHWIGERHIFSDNGVDPSAYRPPLYPAFLALCSLVSSNPQLTARVVQCAMGALTVLFVYFTARRLFDRATARIAGLIFCLAPMTAYFAGVLLTETVFAFFLMAGVWAWSADRPAAAGVCFAAAVATRAVMLPFLVLLAVAGALTWRSREGRRMAIVGLIALACLAPWIGRNAVRVGRVTVADAGWGINLLHGAIDVAGKGNRWKVFEDELAALAARGHPINSEAAARHEALSRIRAHPVRWLMTRARQYPWLFVDSGEYVPVAANGVAFRTALAERQLDTIGLKLGFIVGNTLLVIAALCGAWISRRRLISLAPLWTFPAFLAVAQLPMHTQPRYGLPLVPFLATFAAAGIMAIYRRNGTAVASARVASENGRMLP